MEIVNLPVNEIYADPNFNTRGAIPAPSVIDLARSIQAVGLLQPISVQPMQIDANGEHYNYRIILGHRRHRAFEILEKETIPCIIKEGLTDISALEENFVENINRDNLNIKEEALGLKRLLEKGLSIEDIAKRINKGKQWIQVRINLLELPEEIQNEAAAGFVTQEQIKDIHSIVGKENQFEAVRKIKDARMLGEKKAIKVGKEKEKDKKNSPTQTKRRNEKEVDELINHILDTIGTCLASRALAWANGNISDIEFYRDMMDYAKENNISYSPPPELRHLLVA